VQYRLLLFGSYCSCCFLFLVEDESISTKAAGKADTVPPIPVLPLQILSGMGLLPNANSEQMSFFLPSPLLQPQLPSQ
jgi:hypothetical protein